MKTQPKKVLTAAMLRRQPGLVAPTPRLQAMKEGGEEGKKK